MTEIRWHSRAGQGAVSGAKGLGDVVATTGKEVQAFALYGSAKRGAALRAYNRISDEQIFNHAKFMNPDYVLVIDPALAMSRSLHFKVKRIVFMWSTVSRSLWIRSSVLCQIHLCLVLLLRSRECLN